MAAPLLYFCWNGEVKLSPKAPITSHPPTHRPAFTSAHAVQCVCVCFCGQTGGQGGNPRLLFLFTSLFPLLLLLLHFFLLPLHPLHPPRPPTAQTHPAPIFPPPPPPVGEFVLTSKSNCLKQNYNSRTGCARAQNKSACCT